VAWWVRLARASGLTHDIRRTAPYVAYAQLQFNVPVETSGDVRARLVVRALEMIESCRILREAIARLPGGPWRRQQFVEVPLGTGISRVEGPRGECFTRSPLTVPIFPAASGCVRQPSPTCRRSG
jgi:NADH:ubiquinone oxidoreductase subunit D